MSRPNNGASLFVAISIFVAAFTSSDAESSEHSLDRLPSSSLPIPFLPPSFHPACPSVNVCATIHLSPAGDDLKKVRPPCTLPSFCSPAFPRLTCSAHLITALPALLTIPQA
ncbi:hypothetical protein B0H16DRAFT_1899049, partial [Mycena metata]